MPDASNEAGHPEAVGQPSQLVPQAVDAVLSLIPEGSNTEIVVAMTTLAGYGDEAALRAVEAHLGAAGHSVDYGDRDSDPLSWELDPRVYRLVAQWWERLGLAPERGRRLAATWLGDDQLFGPNSYNSYLLFTRLAPGLADHAAPPLLAACADASVERRMRAVEGLRHTPTEQGLNALVALLGDPSEQVARAATRALSGLASPPSPGSRLHGISASDGVAPRLLGALASPVPAVRRHAVDALAWAFIPSERNRVGLPPQFARVLPALVPLLADADPAAQRAAAKKIAQAGHHLSLLRPSQEAAIGLRLPALDLLPLLASPDKDCVLAALALAGRAPLETGQGRALAGRIVALLVERREEAALQSAALDALGRLSEAAAIPALVERLEPTGQQGHINAVLALGRLRHPLAVPHLVRLLGDLTYRADAREVLDNYATADVLPLVLARLRARRETGFLTADPWEVSYLEAHGDAEALALLRRTESYQFAARYCGAEQDRTLVACRRLERRLYLEAGAAGALLDDPVAAVRHILAGPLHPAEYEGQTDEHAERRARWRNLCVIIDAWLLAEPLPPLADALAEAEGLLAPFPDVVRVAHERWWLDVVRGGQLGLPRVSAVARVRLSPKAPWRLARALVVDEGSGSLNPSEALAWPGLAQITVFQVEHAGWLAALAMAPASFAPRVLCAGVYDDAVAQSIMAWPGVARLERLEILWSRTLSAEVRAELLGRTLAARAKRVWRTPEGTHIVPCAFAPVVAPAGSWIVRADGSALAVATTYAEMTAAGVVLRIYGGPARHSSAEGIVISGLYDVVGGELRRYTWQEGSDDAPGELAEHVVRDGLVAVPGGSG